jgi:hypothetical protein
MVCVSTASPRAGIIVERTDRDDRDRPVLIEARHARAAHATEHVRVRLIGSCRDRELPATEQLLGAPRKV